MTKKELPEYRDVIAKLIDQLEQFAPNWASRIRALDLNPLLIDTSVEIIEDLDNYNRCIVGESHHSLFYECKKCEDIGYDFFDSTSFHRDDETNEIDPYGCALDPTLFYDALDRFVKHFKRVHLKERGAQN